MVFIEGVGKVDIFLCKVCRSVWVRSRFRCDNWNDNWCMCGGKRSYCSGDWGIDRGIGWGGGFVG